MNPAIGNNTTKNNVSLKPAPVLSLEDFEGKKPGDILSSIVNETTEHNSNAIPVAEEFTIFTLNDFDKYRVTKEKYVSDNPASIMIGQAKVAAPQNISPITAESKAGKTAIKNVFIAGSISRDGNVEGLTDVIIAPNPEGKAVIDLDTEQSEYDQQYNLKNVLSRAHLHETPDYYRSYNIRTLELKNYQAFTNEICRLCSEKFNGIHMIVVDGAADFITSVNDEAEANAIITYFITLAVNYNCPVILVVHLNENAGKNGDTMPRGHIGRQAVRKGYCQLNVTKEGDISTLQVLRARKAGSADTPLIRYQYSKEKGYHVSVDPVDLSENQNKDSVVRRKCELIAKRVFAPPTALSHTESISKIMKATSKTESTAKRYIGDLVGWEIIKKHDDGFYRLVLNEDIIKEGS